MKPIKNLNPGETFIDSFGLELTVIAIKELPFLGIERTSPKVRVTFKTQSGREMYQTFRADRMVEVKK
jgi:hypothetical protein